MILSDSISAISSPGSADGRLPCVAQAGLTVAQHGQHHAPANLSARQAKDLGLLTSGTYGPPHIGLLANAVLSWSLASSLAALTRTTGSTLYKLTWKPWVMPSGRLRFRLRASARRTSETALIGWPTPIASNGRGAGNFNRQGGGKPSDSGVISWMADTISDGRQGRLSGRKGTERKIIYRSIGCDGPACGMAHTDHEQRSLTLSTGSYEDVSRQWNKDSEAVAGCSGVVRPGPVNSIWKSADWLHCRDGKWRPVRPGSFPLVDGIPGRVGRLRAYGNAINIEAATAFIKAHMVAEQ